MLQRIMKSGDKQWREHHSGTLFTHFMKVAVNKLIKSVKMLGMIMCKMRFHSNMRSYPNNPRNQKKIFV